jgi:hypothetical protein
MDTSDGRSVCLKLTTESAVAAADSDSPRRLRIIRTRGDQTCEFFKPMTTEQLLGGSA